jgi:hypothetical protein
MMRQIDAPSHCFHDKLFTLSWTSDARWVLVYYRNGQSKPWYKRPGRGYRFKRWFVKKGNDQFQNLANFNSPRATLFFFPFLISFPKRKVVRWEVQHLEVLPSDWSMAEHEPQFLDVSCRTAPIATPETIPPCHVVTPSTDWVLPQCQLNDIASPPSVACDWPVGELSEQALEENVNPEIFIRQFIQTI